MQNRSFFSKETFSNMVKSWKSDSGYLWIVIFATVFTILFNLPIFSIYAKSYRNSTYITLSFLSSIPFTFLFFKLLSMNRYLFLIGNTILMFLSAQLALFVYLYGFLFDSNIYGLIFETSPNEVGGFMGYEMILFTIFAFVISLLLSVVFIKKAKFKNLKSRYATVALLLFLTIFVKLFINNKFLPYAYFENYYTYVQTKAVIDSERIDISKNEFKELSSEKTENLTIVFIVGEAARPSNFHINGYERQTSPNLEKFGATSYKNVITPYTVTRNSVPFILTRGRCAEDMRSAENFSNSEKSFIPIFKKLGYKTHWHQGKPPDSSDSAI